MAQEEEEDATGMQPFEIEQPSEKEGLQATRGRPGRQQKRSLPLFLPSALQCGVALVISCSCVIIILVYSIWKALRSPQGEIEALPDFSKVGDAYNFLRRIEAGCEEGGSFNSLQSEISDEIHSLEVSAFMFVKVVVDHKRPIGVSSTGGKHGFQDNILEFIGTHRGRTCAEVVLHQPLHTLRVSSSAKVMVHGAVDTSISVSSKGVVYVKEFQGTDEKNLVSVNSQGICAVGQVPADAKLYGNVNRDFKTKLLVGDNQGEIFKLHGGDLMIGKGAEAVSKMSEAGQTDISEREQLQSQRRIRTVEAAKEYFDRLFGQCPEDRYADVEDLIPEETVHGVVLSDFMLMKVIVNADGDVGLKSNGGSVHFLEGENTIEFTGEGGDRLFCAELTIKEPLLRLTASAGSKIKVEVEEGSPGGVSHSVTVSSDAIAYIESFVGTKENDRVNVHTRGVAVIGSVPEGHKMLASVAQSFATRLIVGKNEGVISKDKEVGDLNVEKGKGPIAVRQKQAERAIS